MKPETRAALILETGPTAASRNAASEFNELLGEYVASEFEGARKEIQVPRGLLEFEYPIPLTTSEHVLLDALPEDSHPKFGPCEKISLEERFPRLKDTSDLWILFPESDPPFPCTSVESEYTSEEMSAGGAVDDEGDRFCVDEARAVVDAAAPPEAIVPLAPKAIKVAKTSGNPVKGRGLHLPLEGCES